MPRAAFRVDACAQPLHKSNQSELKQTVIRKHSPYLYHQRSANSNAVVFLNTPGGTRTKPQRHAKYGTMRSDEPRHQQQTSNKQQQQWTTKQTLNVRQHHWTNKDVDVDHSVIQLRITPANIDHNGRTTEPVDEWTNEQNADRSGGRTSERTNVDDDAGRPFEQANNNNIYSDKRTPSSQLVDDSAVQANNN